MAGFRAHEHIRVRQDFQRVYDNGRRLSGRLMTVFVAPNGTTEPRLGIAATRKIGSAVVRNRAKRLARELFRHYKPPGGLDIVVIPRREMVDASYVTLEAEFRALLERRSEPARPRPPVPARIGLALIRAYKVFFSPWFTGSCRFLPGCADYTSEAIARFGLLRGTWLGAKRLARCHPLGGHGYDPVPHR